MGNVTENNFSAFSSAEQLLKAGVPISFQVITAKNGKGITLKEGTGEIHLSSNAVYFVSYTVSVTIPKEYNAASTILSLNGETLNSSLASNSYFPPGEKGNLSGSAIVNTKKGTNILILFGVLGETVYDNACISIVRIA
ncbi:hypothetical protein [Paenibacillus sp. NAIST15-1]|uniref:hypothetical protein n=1 Tax=Paenibacillus sp. NAIST15-1 TaxID=1605994 RepID=UPI000869A054|nr:hypothetical protein [Paenibacillus sp. NAIST15-1]GAV13221.1 hypothetical protein PBN151_3155 [Paenibacillus sp. NAIST15-1]